MRGTKGWGPMAAAMLVAACGGGAEPDQAILQEATATRGIPQGVLDFEAAAEDAYDVALQGDVAALRKAAASIRDRWKKLRSAVVRDGLQDASARALDKSVAHLESLSRTTDDKVRLARAANALSDTMDDVFTLYRPKVPPEILSLDFLGRELVLDAMSSDARAAARDLATLQKEWAGLRPKVLKAGGSKQAADLDRLLTSVKEAISRQDWPELRNQSEAELELVDSMEKDLRW